ncbi:hypothetical protein Taro_006968 [Colocasia esculenta]|uniref:Glutamyl-tRNA(Gln) amidotransferase subunit C, chloroplastic/mitochondrial n=1 Tax=Colocasia esculenta TaxID=4460 RepID=A0A843TQ61_COLES|nr:hypothetical protein [Colocasia esculenta]
MKSPIKGVGSSSHCRTPICPDKPASLVTPLPCLIAMFWSVVASRGGGGGAVLAVVRRAPVGSTPHHWLVPSAVTQRSPNFPGRRFCTRARAALEPPDVTRLADTARISLSSEEVEEFAPKIRQVVDWFGQLQAVNLENIDPALRADTDVNVNPREDVPETFENREAMLAAVPSYEDSYIKVPKVLNKE